MQHAVFLIGLIIIESVLAFRSYITTKIAIRDTLLIGGVYITMKLLERI